MTRFTTPLTAPKPAPTLLVRLFALLAALLLAQLTSNCARRPSWQGFHGPAYLPSAIQPAPSGHNPPPVRLLLPARRLDSLTAHPAPPMGPFRP